MPLIFIISTLLRQAQVRLVAIHIFQQQNMVESWLMELIVQLQEIYVVILLPILDYLDMSTRIAYISGHLLIPMECYITQIHITICLIHVKNVELNSVMNK